MRAPDTCAGPLGHSSAAHASSTPETHLTDLPEDVLRSCLRQLSAKDLAAVSVQDRRLRTLAGDASLWQPLCSARWAESSAAHFRNDWRAMYSARMRLPPSMPSAVDRVVSLQRRAAGELGRLPGHASLMFDETMRAVFTVGVAVANDPAARRSPDYELYQKAVLWWLTERSEAAVAFVRRAHTALDEFDMWRAGFVNWPDTPWRRSAVAFLLAIVSSVPAPRVCPSVTARIAGGAADLDSAIRALADEEAEPVQVPRPPGLPRSHWWFHMETCAA